MSGVKFIKVRDVKSPERGTSVAAGIDFFVPKYSQQFITDLIKLNPFRNIKYGMINGQFAMEVAAHERIVIPSGIKVCIDSGTMLNASNKSGVGTKKGLVYTAHVVDSDFAGEICFGLLNTSDADIMISCEEKIIQFVHTPILIDPVEEISTDEFDAFHSKSERGEGWQGSTGSK